jgi:hypothetical protein
MSCLICDMIASVIDHEFPLLKQLILALEETLRFNTTPWFLSFLRFRALPRAPLSAFLPGTRTAWNPTCSVDMTAS